jgi:O-antigen ligase
VLTARQPGAPVTTLPATRGVLLAAVSVCSLSLAQGGFAPSAWHSATIALLAAAAAMALLPRSAPLASSSLAPAALVALLAAWSALSALWSVDPSLSLHDVQRTFLYASAALAFAVAGRGLPLGVLYGTTAVAAWSLGGRLLHGAHLDPYEGTLLTGPLGYANALGALSAIGAVLALVLALGESGRARAFAVAPLIVLLPALALTGSRGAWLSAVGGAAVGAALLAGRRRLAAATLLCAAGLLTAGLLHTPQHVGNRAAYWQAARRVVAGHTLAGTGAGTFSVDYVRAPPARDAHSLYLQSAAELGVIGLCLTVAIMGVPLGVGLRRRSALPVAGLTVFALHAGVDWDWQMPAVTVAGLALAVAACGRDSPAGEPSAGATRVVDAAVAAVIGGVELAWLVLFAYAAIRFT